MNFVNKEVFSRRNALIVLGAATGSAVATTATIKLWDFFEKVLQGGTAIPGTKPSEAPEFRSILAAPIAIFTDINVRTEPSIPRYDPKEFSTRLAKRFSIYPFLLPWEEMVEINGTKLNGAKMILIENASIVAGENTGMFGAKKGLWIRLEQILLKNGSTRTGYVAFSEATEGSIYDFGVRPFENSRNENNIGTVTVLPPGVSLLDKWAQIKREQIAGTSPFYRKPDRSQYKQNNEEFLYPKVRAVAAGDESLADRDEMIATGVRPNVRIFADIGMPGLTQNSKVGEIELGTEIDNVVRTGNVRTGEPGEWGVFLRKNAKGPIVGENGKPLEMSDDTVLVIAMNHLFRAEDAESPVFGQYDRRIVTGEGGAVNGKEDVVDGKGQVLDGKGGVVVNGKGDVVGK